MCIDATRFAHGDEKSKQATKKFGFRISASPYSVIRHILQQTKANVNDHLSATAHVNKNAVRKSAAKMKS